MSRTAGTAHETRASALRAAAGVAAAVIAAIAVNTLIALVGRAAGAPGSFGPLHPVSYVPLTVAGVLAGAGGWAVLRRWSHRPAAVLRWLVPATVTVSLVPDLALLSGHTTGVGVAALIAMHIALAAVAVPVFARVLPVPAAVGPGIVRGRIGQEADPADDAVSRAGTGTQAARPASTGGCSRLP